MLETFEQLVTSPDAMRRIDIPFTRLRIHLEAMESIHLPPFSGSVFHGGLGAALRRSCCAMGLKTCTECLVRTSCVYAAAFETTADHVSGGRHRLTQYPRPFILEPPVEGNSRIRPGGSLELHLVLIGDAIRWAPYFVHALIELGRSGIGSKRGAYRIVRILSDLEDDDRAVFDGASRRFLGSPPEKSMADFFRFPTPEQRISLLFESPTRIKSQNRLTKELDFELLMRNLLRRLSLMVEVCAGRSWNLDYKSILERAREVKTVESRLRWIDWRRYSSRQKSAMKLGGFVGSICFEGDLSPFIPFIRIGEYIHVGKAVTFGLGKYRMNLIQ